MSSKLAKEAYERDPEAYEENMRRLDKFHTTLYRIVRERLDKGRFATLLDDALYLNKVAPDVDAELTFLAIVGGITELLKLYEKTDPRFSDTVIVAFDESILRITRATHYDPSSEQSAP